MAINDSPVMLPITPAQPTVNPQDSRLAETEKKTAGQRRINVIWEVTQALIALTGIGTTLAVAASIALLATYPDISERQSSISSTAFMMLSNLGSLIIGFYFGRTNHQRIGGVGDNIGQTEGR